METFVNNEVILRLALSLGGLGLFFVCGLIFPFRTNQPLFSFERWITNLIFSFGNGILVRIAFPLTLIEITNHPSIFQFSDLEHAMPFWAQTLIGVLFLDLLIYWQHRLTHKIPILWQLHRMHHSDLEIDSTSAGRFHPLEIVISFILKALVIYTLPIPALAVLIFEILLNFSSIFNHANIVLPGWLEKGLRCILITPSLHRIHHSSLNNEMNSNFGFSIVFWDHLFKSYRGQSQKLQTSMTIGLNSFRKPEEQKIYKLLIQPFLKE